MDPYLYPPKKIYRSLGNRLFPAAFTLVELLTVIVIIGILAGILIPVVGMVRDRTRATVCQSNLRQVYTALMMYVDENKGWLPPGPNSMGGLTVWPHADYTTGDTNNMALHLAPYMGCLSASQWNRRVNPFFFCPGQSDKPADQNYRTGYRTYGILTGWRNGENYPFGYLSAQRPKPLADYLDTWGAKDPWVLRDDDREKAGSEGATDLVAKRSHKKGRNYLFFSGRVKLLNEAQEEELKGKLQG